MTSLSKYTSFIKFEHTLFSLPLLFAGALFAEGKWPTFRVTVLIIIAGASARVVALVLNRIIDREIDRKNPRTANRHLSSGAMSLLEGWLVGVIGLGVYVYAAWLLSDFCLRWSWIPILGFAAYPFFKRFTKWAHVGLGAVWSIVPLSGYFAVRPSLQGTAPVFVLGFFSLFWLAGFDIIYATQDEEFDRRAGLYSLPAAFGSGRALRFAALFHFVSFVALLVLYIFWLSGPITVMLLTSIGILLLLEQLYSQSIDLAFFHINSIIGITVLIFVLSGLKGV